MNKFDNLNPNAGAKEYPISKSVGDKVIYLSSSGSENNSGTSPDAPRANIERVPEYLKDGYSVLLKAGSEWYVPSLAWKLTDIMGSEDSPITLGTYGEGKPPVVAALHKVTADMWQSEGEEIISTPVVGDVIRFYTECNMRIEVCDLDELDADSFVQRNGRIYIKAENAPALTEYMSDIDGDLNERIIYLHNVNYFSLQNFVLKGGRIITLCAKAPSDHLAFEHMEFCQMMKYATAITVSTENFEAYHNCLVIKDCIFDRKWIKKADYCFREEYYGKQRTSDGIFMTDAHINAHIVGNKVIDFAHSAINLSAFDRRFKGIHNCIVERNVVSGTNTNYLRACETLGSEGTCTNNTVRYNVFYDLTNSSHVFGEGNKYYCNIFAYINPTKVSTTVQPYAMDSMSWMNGDVEFIARGNVITNNTIYNCSGSLAFNGNIYNSTYANNLFVGWDKKGAVYMRNTKEEISFISNCFFSENNDNIFYASADDADFKLADLNAMEKSTGNIFANPDFTAPESNDFTLSEGSPCAASGVPLSRFTDEPYLDMDGNPFDPEHPSMGAFSAKRV